MRAWVTVLVGGLLATGLLAGCQSSSPHRAGRQTVPRLDGTRAAAVGLSAVEAQAAVRLCAAKCLRCHEFYDPAQYSQTEWRRWMGKMSRKARLQPDQETLLTRYFAGLRVQ